MGVHSSPPRSMSLQSTALALPARPAFTSRASHASSLPQVI